MVDMRDEPLLIDCGTCTERHTDTCEDCVVTLSAGVRPATPSWSTWPTSGPWGCWARPGWSRRCATRRDPRRAA